MHEVISAIAQTDKLRAIAVIIRQEGPAYRPLGAIMAIYEDDSFDGHISSGCVEADIVSHCVDLENIKILRYGAGSPFLDLRLPCGGAMEVLLIPYPNQAAFQHLDETLRGRRPAAISISLKDGSITSSSALKTGSKGDHFHLYFEPALNFLVFGNGHEAQVFADLVDGAGYDVTLYSTNSSTLENSRISQSAKHLMPKPKITQTNIIDRWSAITLFFHDHDLEEEILVDALRSDAFYIGAQGSFQTHQNRLENLRQRGVANISRLRGPIGLIPKTRDPQTLAISVLAEIHSVAQKAEL